MTWLFTLAAILTAGMSFALLFRLVRATRQAERAFREVGVNPLTDALRRGVSEAIDRSMLNKTGREGLGDIEVRCRENQHSSRTATELLTRLAPACQASTFAECVQLVKMVYQLQDTMQIPAETMAPILDILKERLSTSTAAPRPVGRIELVTPGILLDPSTMMYLTSGSRVRQPLGMVIYDRDGKVMSKARVFCS